MTNRPQVSIVIPARDYGRYLPDCVRSLAAQTMLPDYVVVVDDGSTDETPEIIEALRLDYPALNIHSHRFGQPQGFVAAINAGIAATDTELVARVDADDTVRPRYVEALTTALAEHPDAAFAFPLVELTGDESGVMLSGKFSPARLCYEGNYIPHIGIFRREALLATQYHELPTHVDWDLWLSFVDLGMYGVFVDEVLYEWQRHPGSMTLRSMRIRLESRLTVHWRHRRVMLRYALPGLPYLLRAIWRRLRLFLPFRRRLPYRRTPSCWVDTRRV